jgi:fluoride exporter
MKTFFVILGAAIGAPARFAIDQYIRRFTTKPYGIFLVNILGSFVWGVSMDTSTTLHALFVIGFAGAFTTWSTFMLDFFFAYESKSYKSAAINLSASLVFGLLAAWAGVTLAK